MSCRVKDDRYFARFDRHEPAAWAAPVLSQHAILMKQEEIETVINGVAVTLLAATNCLHFVLYRSMFLYNWQNKT